MKLHVMPQYKIVWDYAHDKECPYAVRDWADSTKTWARFKLESDATAFIRLVLGE